MIKKITATRLSLAVVVFVLSLNPLCSQSFDDGTNLVFIGFGLPPTKRILDHYDKYKVYEEKHIRNYGTVVLKYEHGLHKNFGVGIHTEYSGSSLTYKSYDGPSSSTLLYSAVIKSNLLAAYLRMNAHLPLDEKFDFYGGAGLGYFYLIDNRVVTDEKTKVDDIRKSTDLEFDYQLTLGMRFMIKESTGIFIEIGKATTLAQMGLIFKF